MLTFGFHYWALVTTAALACRYIVQAWRRRALIVQHGCEPIVQYPSTDRLGKDYDRIVKESFQVGRMNRTAMEQYDKCGSATFEARAVDNRVIVTSDPENLQALHVKMDDWARDVRPAGFPFSGRDNILNQNGEPWRRTRNLVNPLFKKAELMDVDNFEKFVDRFINLIPRNGETQDLSGLIRRLFLDHSSESIFGESLDSLRNPEESDAFMSTFSKAHAGVGNRIRPTGLKLWMNNHLPTRDKQWLADCKAVHDFIDECVTRHRKGDTEATKDTTSDKRYILIEGMSKSFPDPTILRFQLLGVFASSLQNGAMLFVNCLFLLARHQHEWGELRKQALVFESSTITLEQLQSLSYFRYTIQETLRMHTPVPRTRRIALRDTVLPRGGGPGGRSPALVKKGTTIWGDRYPKSFDPAIWGEDVDVFRPSRFQGRRLGWEFHPFGGGTRVCPAGQQVVSQCMYLLFRLVREFEGIENRDPCLEFVEGVQMCLESKNGCKIALQPPSAVERSSKSVRRGEKK